MQIVGVKFPFSAHHKSKDLWSVALAERDAVETDRRRGMSIDSAPA